MPALPGLPSIAFSSEPAIQMDSEVIRLIVDWGTRIIAVASVSYWAICRIEEVFFDVWFPKANWPNFWIFYDRFKETFRRLSIGPKNRNGNGSGNPRT